MKNSFPFFKLMTETTGHSRKTADVLFLLLIPGAIFISNYYGYRINQYNSYFVILALLLFIPITSSNYRQLYYPHNYLIPFFIAFSGTIIRYKLSLFNFLHINRHGTRYISMIKNLNGHEIVPYGFSWNYFWYLPMLYSDFHSENLFFMNILINVLSAILLYNLIYNYFKNRAAALSSLILFIFSPMQIAVSGTESHYNLLTLLLLHFLLVIDAESEYADYSLPYIVAFISMIRPSCFLISIPLFLLWWIKRKSGRLKYYSAPKLISATVLLLYFPMLAVWNGLHKIPESFQSDILSLLIFSNDYYHPLFLFTVMAGTVWSLYYRKTRRTTAGLLILFTYMMIFSTSRLQNYHGSIYYQSILDIFYIISAVFLMSLMKNKWHIIVFTLLLAILQIHSTLSVYTELYDDQIEYRFIRENSDLIGIDDVVITVYEDDRNRKNGIMTSEFFLSADTLFDYHNRNYIIYTMKLPTVYDSESVYEFVDNTIKVLRMLEAENIFLYRDLMLEESHFNTLEVILREKGVYLKPEKTRSFIYKERIPSHFKNGDTMEIGFYRVQFDHS